MISQDTSLSTPESSPQQSTSPLRELRQVDLVGIMPERQFDFPTIRHEGRALRAGAAASVEAVFIDGKPDWTRAGEIQLIDRSLIVPCPFNPRHYVNREAMLTLIASVGAQGIHTPLDISQHPDGLRAVMLSGHRRLWVAEAHQLDLLPCKLDPRGVLSEVEMREAVIRYNEGQEKPAPIDRAQALFEFIQSSKLSQNEVAARFNMTPSEVSNSLRLLTLPTDVKEQVNRGRIAVATALELSRHPGGERAQSALAGEIIDKKMTTRQVHDLISRLRTASSLGMNRRGPLHRPNISADEARYKQLEFHIPGANPVTITVSSKKAELRPQQIQEALREVVMGIPVEMNVHHRQLAHPGDVAIPTRISSSPPSPESVVKASDISATTPAAPTDTLAGTAPRMRLAPVVRHGSELLRSAAADSIRAVFTDGKPDWSQPTVVQLIHRQYLTPHPKNPRKLVSPAAMQVTLQSIEAEGIHTPLHISEHPDDSGRAYVLGGHRRLWCINEVKYDLVPCRLDSRGVLSDLEIRESLFRDNEGQERPAPIDRAQSFADYIRVSGLRPEAAAVRLGVSHGTMIKLMALLDLPPAVQDLINMGQINESVAHAIAGYEGGRDSQIALAYRAVEQKLTAQQIKDFIGKNRVSLSGLTIGGSQASSTDRLWNTVGDKRILVHLHSATGELERTETLRALEMALRQLQDLTGETRADRPPNQGTTLTEAPSAELPNARVEVKNILLSSLPTRNARIFKEIAERYLAKFLQTGPHGLEVSAAMGAALKREATSTELKKLELTHLDTTVDAVRAWYGLPEAGAKGKAALFQVLEYLGTVQRTIRELPPSKKQFTSVDVANFNLDVSTPRGITRQRAAEEYRRRLEAFPEALERRVLTMVDADRAEQSKSSLSAQGDLEFDMKELAEAGFKRHKHLRFFISNWTRDVENRPWDPSRGADQFSFKELYGYYTYALARFMEVTGGNTTTPVGKSQLQRYHIVYSENVSGTNARVFGWKNIFHELKGNLEAVNTVYQRHTGIRIDDSEAWKSS